MVYLFPSSCFHVRFDNHRDKSFYDCSCPDIIILLSDSGMK